MGQKHTCSGDVKNKAFNLTWNVLLSVLTLASLLDCCRVQLE